MGIMNYLNVGCGNKFHKDWTNVDMVSNSPHVVSHDLLKGIPFPEGHFDVVYHSQVLEHIPKEMAHFFIKECFRVLSSGGIIRVVVPDLENIIFEYQKCLKEVLESPNDQSEANYDWILLEMYDQTVRSSSGGQMAAFLKQPYLANETYILNRIGHVGRSIRDHYLREQDNGNLGRLRISNIKRLMKRSARYLRDSVLPDSYKIGSFRTRGEIHMWMYDRYSLSRLLVTNGFMNIRRKDPFNSDIPNWYKYELDHKDGLAFDPTSLFMEANRP